MSTTITAEHVKSAERGIDGVIAFHPDRGFTTGPLNAQHARTVDPGTEVVVDHDSVTEALRQADEHAEPSDDRYEVAAEALRSQLAAESYAWGEDNATD